MTISVVIPTLNEEEALPALLRILGEDPLVSEVIVVDGGSTDTTCAIARGHAVTLLQGPGGRGQQLCEGAKLARGDVLWFLHADTRPAPGAAGAILAALEADPQAPGGNFAVTFDGDSDFAHWLTGFYAWLRSHAFYYGDSAIFVRRAVYDALGGIRPIALMEDYDFICRLEKAGETRNITDPGVTTSSRRFRHRKPWKIFLQWVYIHALYYCRASGDRMARLYKSEQHAPADHHP